MKLFHSSASSQLVAGQTYIFHIERCELIDERYLSVILVTDKGGRSNLKIYLFKKDGSLNENLVDILLNLYAKATGKSLSGLKIDPEDLEDLTGIAVSGTVKENEYKGQRFLEIDPHTLDFVSVEETPKGNGLQSQEPVNALLK